VLTALAAIVLLAACGGETSGPKAPQGAHDANVARRRLADRPPLVLVRRDGDPTFGVAFAATHDLGPVASAATAAALHARLTARGFTVRARPSALGFALVALVPNAGEARRLVQTLPLVLAEPFAAADPALPAVRGAVQALGASRAAGPAEASVAACSGELALGEPSRWDPTSDKARAELESWLRSLGTVKTSALAAVGPQAILTAVEDTLSRTEDWPEGELVNDAWPLHDDLGTDFSPNAPRRLSLALRLASENSASRAVALLAEPHSTLARRLAALRPEWRLERALAVGRPRGACLRIDATPLHGEVAPAASDVAHALAVVSDEVNRNLSADARGEIDGAIVGTTDPGDAAAAAAWHALVGRNETGETRSAVAYTAASADKSHFDLPAALAALRQASTQPLMEVVRRAEPGQGRLWALLAPTCGTTVEAAKDAGEAAFVVSALARTATGGDVTVEPWIATDGVGLLVGTRRASTNEGPDAQARRLGRALGELVAATRPSPPELVATRDELAAAVGGEQHRGYFVALDALSGGHPSWLEPRGTFAALGTAPMGGFEAALGRWLSRPLRLAVLTNGNDTQADLVRVEAERWLRPGRSDALRCPARARTAPAPSEITLTVSGESPEGTYLGVPFPAYERRLPSEARATLLLLNRSGGWLDQTFADMPASATALALGGPDQAALVVEVVAAEGQRSIALERLRALFERLASGRLAQSDVDFARRELAQSDAAELLDPRRRVVATWRNARPVPEPPLDAARLAKWLGTLRRSGAVVVNVVPRG
jgi:hypothetical protein